MKGLSNILKNIEGEIEIGRVMLTSGTAAAITTPIGFQIWDMLKGAHFDVAAWCAAYPAGIGALVSSGVFAIGSKEKAVATAKQTNAGASDASA